MAPVILVITLLLILGIGSGAGIAAYRRYEYVRPKSRDSKIILGLAGVTIVLIGALGTALAFFTPGRASSPTGQDQTTCVTGMIKSSGSTALYLLIQQVAEDYHRHCPASTINVGENSSGSGLADVESGLVDIGASDICAAATQSDLVDHQIAINPFTLIVSEDVSKVKDLTTDQIRGIYTGRVTNWKQVGGPDEPIASFNRPTTSGTFATFKRYVMGDRDPSGPTHREIDRNDQMAMEVQSTPGALAYVDLGTAHTYHLSTVTIDGKTPTEANIESNTYAFWAIEHLYTKGIPQPNSLTNTFIQYMTSPSALSIAASLSYVPFNAMKSDSLATHHC